MFEVTRDLMYHTPPAIVVQAEVFDEQALKREWDEATADAKDAMERKAAVLQKALKRWPMVPGRGGRMKHSPEMRRFVREVLGMPDHDEGRGLNGFALRLLKLGPQGISAYQKASNTRRGQIRRAAVELVDKYRLGADPKVCMEALSKFIEETRNG